MRACHWPLTTRSGPVYWYLPRAMRFKSRVSGSRFMRGWGGFDQQAALQADGKSGAGGRDPRCMRQKSAQIKPYTFSIAGDESQIQRTADGNHHRGEIYRAIGGDECVPCTACNRRRPSRLPCGGAIANGKGNGPADRMSVCRHNPKRGEVSASGQLHPHFHHGLSVAAVRHFKRGFLEAVCGGFLYFKSHMGLG